MECLRQTEFLGTLSRRLCQRRFLAFNTSQLSEYLDYNQHEADRLRKVYESRLTERLEAEQRLQHIRRCLADLQTRMLQHAASSGADRAGRTRTVYRFIRETQSAVYGEARPARRVRYRPLPPRRHQPREQVPSEASTPQTVCLTTNARADVVPGTSVCSDARAPYAAASLASKYQEPTPSVQLTVIGMASTPYRKRREAPRQPNLGDKQQATLYISADMIGCNSALGKIQPGDWLWIVSYFDRNQGLWRAFIRPPRYRGRGRLGVFATRSPHRPNAVGLSLVQVIETRSKSERQTGDMELCIQGCDLLHHTPILSVEPYQPETQNWPGARVGWLQEDAALTTPIWDDLRTSCGATIPVRVASELAGMKLQWLVERLGLFDIGARLEAMVLAQQLARQRNAATRWLPPGDNGHGTLCLGAYRLHYQYVEKTNLIHILDICTGFRADVLTNPMERRTDPEVAEHWAFCERFGFGQKEARDPDTTGRHGDLTRILNAFRTRFHGLDSGQDREKT